MNNSTPLPIWADIAAISFVLGCIFTLALGGLYALLSRHASRRPKPQPKPFLVD